MRQDRTCRRQSRSSSPRAKARLGSRDTSSLELRALHANHWVQNCLEPPLSHLVSSQLALQFRGPAGSSKPPSKHHTMYGAAEPRASIAFTPLLPLRVHLLALKDQTAPTIPAGLLIGGVKVAKGLLVDGVHSSDLDVHSSRVCAPGRLNWRTDAEDKRHAARQKEIQTANEHRRRHTQRLLQPLRQRRGERRDGRHRLKLAETKCGKHGDTVRHGNPDESRARAHSNVGLWAITAQWHLVNASGVHDHGGALLEQMLAVGPACIDGAEKK
eukprot:CAMPEP_0115854484 /NCGR_PEP_ID=MMETSP0287-20121206/14048_1 /TAXON_ID=412157 /ORGANISM="Chrysochromulina rotalis, Strain UIO044" /LENGTH=270 /DNA_ID=CAMNT_0003308603 /DNA_START=378 /DNA_END=1191 /DNA_ORIENTATION=-